MTIYKINGLPIGWALAPPLMVAWLKHLKIRGEKIGNRICFNIQTVKQALRDLRVPHVADNLDEADLEFAESDCIAEEV